jgi:hypothetical protein
VNPARIVRRPCAVCADRDPRDWRVCVACTDGTVTEREAPPTTKTETRRRRGGETR